MSNDISTIPFHLMRQLIQEHTARWQKSLPDLTKQQYAVLTAVREKPGIEQMELMDAAVSTKATLAELLARMEKKGLIARQQGDADRRRRFIFLTDAGQAALVQAKPVADKVDAAFLDALSAPRQQALVELLQDMLSGVKT
ncbi:MarR family transcriptional regulator [Siccibacter turicensis]|uniref:MarR family winged helix-turn-helix transcriptional regulator n=1 Tax=Siccibacter turicensis TaxID=357233 RepID=UPI002A6A337E|nr:MarR family transcriptional regulator [Siccibacter turicensis]MDY0970871.1 MarR family transcriptional regulator [Siccibacter turicensis]